MLGMPEPTSKERTKGSARRATQTAAATGITRPNLFKESWLRDELATDFAVEMT